MADNDGKYIKISLKHLTLVPLILGTLYWGFDLYRTVHDNKSTLDLLEPMLVEWEVHKKAAELLGVEFDPFKHGHEELPAKKAEPNKPGRRPKPVPELKEDDYNRIRTEQQNIINKKRRRSKSRGD